MPGSGFLQATDVAVHADGWFVVAGYGSAPNGRYAFHALKYLADGTLDTSFGVNGVATVDMTPATDSEGVWSIALQTIALPGGSSQTRILLAGQAVVATTGKQQNPVMGMAVAGLTLDGQLDPAFGNGGRVLLPPPATSTGAIARDVLVDCNGRIVLEGSAGDNMAVARLQSNGALDATFGGGTVIVNFGARSQGFAAALTPGCTDQKIVVAGGVVTPKVKGQESWDMAVARLTSSGTLDASFSGDGRATVDFSGRLEQANALAIDPSGNVVLAGYSYPPGSLLQSQIAVARLAPAGTLDSTFAGGRVTADLGPSFDNVNDIVVDNTGVIATGSASGQLYAARFTPSGTLDTSFGTGGASAIDFGPPGADETYGDGIAIDSLGRVLIVGYARGEGSSKVGLTALNR